MENTEVIKKKSQTATEPIINIIPLSADDENMFWETEEIERTEIKDVQEKEKDDPDSSVKNIEEQPESEQESEDEGHTETEEEEGAKKKTLRTSKDRRFADFTRKIKQRDALLQEVYAQKSHLEHQLILKEQEKIAAEENTIKIHIDNIERSHAQALEEGNNEKAAEASRLMAQYAARHETLAKQKNELVNSVQEKPRTQEPTPPQLSHQNEEFQNNGAEWIKKNSWADSKSENFDEEMLEEAENYTNILMKQYKFEGRASEIGRPEFFNQITNYVKDSFGISSPPTPPKEKLFNARGTPNVSPVNRTGTVPNIKKSNQEIVLTPEQIKTAHSMSGIKLNGQRISDHKTLENLYKESLKKIERGSYG